MIKVNTASTTIRGERIVCGVGRWNLCAKNPPSQPTNNNTYKWSSVSRITIISGGLCRSQRTGGGGKGKIVERRGWKRRRRKSERHKLKQMGTYMHHDAFRSFTAGSFHLRPATVCFYCCYDVMVFRCYCHCFSRNVPYVSPLRKQTRRIGGR